MLALAAASAPAARAGLPSCANSSFPSCIALVGSSSGVADPAGLFTITIRDPFNNPIPGSDVCIDFSGAADLSGVYYDIRVSCNQMYPGMRIPPGGASSVCATTNMSGVATFDIMGGAQNAGNSPSVLTYSAKVLVYGIFCSFLSVQAYDQDGAGGVGANDLSAWLGDKFAAGSPFYARSDYDCNHSLGANDLSVWLSVKFAGHSTASATAPYIAGCP